MKHALHILLAIVGTCGLARLLVRWRLRRLQSQLSHSMVGAILLLVEEEGASVRILCQNPETGTHAVEVSASWTGWEDRRFEGDSLAACLCKAVAAMTVGA